MENTKIINYLEVKETVDRMISLLDKYELMYFEERVKEYIMSPLLADGFQQDDIELFFKVLIANALTDQPKLSESL